MSSASASASVKGSSSSHPAKSLALLIASWLVACPASAQTTAENAAAAQALFDEGMKLMRAGQFAEACPKLRSAQNLDPGMATQFRLAECYEHTGRLASAWATYVEVADAAKAAKSREREAFARKRAASLEPRLSRLTIIVPPPLSALPGLEIKRDGNLVDKALSGTAVPVDPGEHVVSATAPGRRPWQGKSVASEQPIRLEVIIPLLEDLPPSPLLPKQPPDDLPVPSRRSVTPAIVGGAAAIVGVGVGATLLAVSIAKGNDVLRYDAQLGPGKCTGAALTSSECTDLLNQLKSADALHNVAVGVFVGAGALAAGSLLYLLWPSSKASSSLGHDLRASPTVGRGQAGMILSGTF